MTRRVAWFGLTVSATLFVAWLGYLGYLVATDARPTVVSYPQLLAATVDVVATVTAGPDGQLPRTVTVVAVLRGQAPGLASGKTITVTNLPDSTGYIGPGDYLLPLVPTNDGKEFHVPRPASSPGSEFGKAAPEELIYPWNAAVQQQYRDYHGS